MNFPTLQCLPCLFGKSIHASTNLHLQDQIMFQDFYLPCLQWSYCEYSHQYSWFRKLHPFARYAMVLNDGKSKLQNFQTTFNILLHFASLQNVVYLHTAVYVWFTWNKTILNKCHLLGDSIENRLSHSPQNWSPYLLHSTNCEWLVTNLKTLMLFPW